MNELTSGQIISESNQFDMPMDANMNQGMIVKNLIALTSLYPYMPGSFPDMALCSFDVHTLLSYINKYRIKVVTEFGFGVSSAIMTMLGVKVMSFSLDVSEQGKNNNITEKVNYVQCDIMDEAYREKIHAACLVSDMIFIDCFHSYEMAEYYYEHFLSKTLKPVYIHDMYNFANKRRTTGEQKFLMDNVIGNSYDVFTCTDLLMEHRKFVCSELNTPVGKGMGRCCAMILHPSTKEEE